MQNTITFSSMTEAMKAREVLRGGDISAKMTRTPAKYRRGSCGYSLVIDRDFKKALALLKSRKIPYRDAFPDDGD